MGKGVRQLRAYKADKTALRLTKEYLWTLPLASISLITLALLHTPPTFPVPQHNRIVVDGGGAKIPIAVPYRGTALTWCGMGADTYLENTTSPETLISGGNSKDREKFAKSLYQSIYPEIATKDAYWINGLVDQHGGGINHAGELESLLSYDVGAFLGGCGSFGTVPALRQIGLPALSVMGGGTDWDEVIFAISRIENRVIDQSEHGEALIRAYKQAFADLAAELQPETIAHRPKIVLMDSSIRDSRLMYIKNERNSYQIYLARAGVENAADRSTSQWPDVERVLYLDPDIIFYVDQKESIQDFKTDPRWKGLKAVKENRIYKMPGSFPGILAGLHFQPLWVRWMAEIVYPDRLKPKLRTKLREHFEKEFGYRLTEEQIDAQLRVNENQDQPGYARFFGAYPPKSVNGVSQ
jgi:iron complex transport system substrate-binding protein